MVSDITRLAAVRPAVVADARAASVVHVASWQKAYRGMLSDSVLDGLSVDEWAQKRASFLKKPGPEQRFWVIDSGPDLAGFLDTGASRDKDAPAGDRIAEVYAMYLHPKYWGRGLGRALMQRGLQDLRSRQWRRANLWVLDQNVLARRFYEAAGFRADGSSRPDSFRGCTWTDLRYSLDLS